MVWWIKIRWTFLLKACYTPDTSLILDGDRNKMADRPFEPEKTASVFDSPDMKWGEGLFDAFHTVKDSFVGRDGTVKLALNATSMVLSLRGNDRGGEVYET